MERNRVLITSVSRKVSLVKTFREAGWHVTGSDLDHNAIALKFCDDIALPDRENGPFDIIIPTRDEELKSGSHRASDETIDTCIDKFKFYKFCKANGLLTPEIYLVKPRTSKSGKEIECVWQELIEGDEYSVDLFSDFNGQVISIVPRKRIRVLSGESTVTMTVLEPEVLQNALLVANSLHLIGHNCLQCFVTKSGIYWTDINCRFGGASIVSIKAGCNSPKWLLSLINGQEVKPCIGDYKVGLTGYSYQEWEFE